MGKILRAIKAPIARQAIQFIKQNSPEWLPKITRKRGAKDERLFWPDAQAEQSSGTTPTKIQPGHPAK